MWKVKVSYSVILTFSRLEDAKSALDMLFEGGITEVTIAFEPTEDAIAEDE